MSLATSIPRACFVLFFSLLLPAQQSEPNQPPQTSSPGAAQQPSPQADILTQMRDDLNKMDSLNMNMSTEIEFLHDQNLQILLRTNSQMWTVLLRDLRRQLQAEEQRRSVASPPSSK